MAYFTVTDANGFPTAFYSNDPAENGENIPSDALPITDEQWTDLVINQGRRKFIDGNVVEYDPPVVVIIPGSVSARQFKLQLLAAGLLDQVDAWISSQSKAVQIAYEYSGSFVRTEPMMAAGFAAIGFTDQQIDDFFTAAAAL